MYTFDLVAAAAFCCCFFFPKGTLSLLTIQLPGRTFKFVNNLCCVYNGAEVESVTALLLPKVC